MSILYWPELFRQGIDRSRILLHTNLRCECTVSGCWHPVITREQCARTGAEAGGSLFGYRVWRGRDDGGVRYNDFSLRGVAQLGSALRSGRRGPGFKSRLPDQLQINVLSDWTDRSQAAICSRFCSNSVSLRPFRQPGGVVSRQRTDAPHHRHPARFSRADCSRFTNVSRCCPSRVHAFAKPSPISRAPMDRPSPCGNSNTRQRKPDPLNSPAPAR